MSVYILSGSRTPLGSFLGSLANCDAPILGATAIKGAIEKSSIDKDKIDQVYMGNVLMAGVGQAPARQASINAGLSKYTPCTTVNKVCGSGMETVILGARSILVGDNNLVIAGGMENMSMAPHLLKNSRTGISKFGSAEVLDSMQVDGLTDAYAKKPMGNFAEDCVSKFEFTREAQDEFAINSFKKAQQAHNDGVFKTEITPVTISSRKGEVIISEDEGPFKAKFDKIPGLRPAFVKDGTVTAANSSTINDGAAALVLGGEKYKDQAKFKIVAYAGFAHEPSWFTTAPARAMEKVLEKAKMNLSDIDLFEINEAFAVVTMATIKELNLDESKVNIFGGAVSLGHPIGCSGTRIVLTLMNALEKESKKYGMASICIGGGEALALIIERI